MLEADWTGRRVVVRRVTANGDRPSYQDVLGDLLVLGSENLTIETRTGRVDVARTDVASARLVQPAARDVLALEAVSARGWRAHEVETSSDGWLLRADRGWTGRANSALPLRTITRPLDDVLGELTAWYAERGLPARIQLPLPAADGLNNALARRGWSVADHTDVLVSRLDSLAGHTSRPRAGTGANVDVRLDPRPDDEWLAAYHYRGGGLPAGAAALVGRHDRAVFARVELDGAVAAIGRGAVDDGWLGITALDVAAPHRRLGLAATVVGVIGRWATAASTSHGDGSGSSASDGAPVMRAYVQTDQTNVGAHRFFARLGFYPHHSYLYRSAPTIN